MAERYPARVTGPLAAHAEGFRGRLADLGYTQRTARDHVYVLVHLSRWLSEEGLEPAELTALALERFVAARRAAGYRRWRSVRSLRPLLDHLRLAQVVPPAEPTVAWTPLDDLLDAYRRYLRVERRLAERTVDLKVGVAGRFLSGRAARGDGLDLEGLEASDVTGFVLGESGRCSPGSMKVLTSALRSLLGFLFVTGVTDRDLTAAVPAVAGWQRVSLPAGVDASVVAALLGSCDRATAVGRRDFAVLTLLVRLGLRAGEVAALSFDDVDWGAGEVVVRGKGNQLDRLPLPQDVGEAIVDYLRHGRPRSQHRALFLRACAPEGAMTAKAVVMVPRSASARAGIPVVGAHRLRKTAATSMLGHGASLSEVAQVLRHRSEATTRIYAAVDRAALDVVVRPWPGTER